MNRSHLIKFIFIPFVLLLTGCGHNVLTNYEVEGLDLSVPIFGYPFGIRIGSVKVNSNLIRGNAAYSSHANTGTELGSGTIQKTTVIEFASNTQINEGNIEKILTSENVSDDVKKAVVTDYLVSQTAPDMPAVSTNTPTSLTAAGNDPKIHKNKLERSKPILDGLIADSIVVTIVKLILNFLLMTTAGKIVSSILAAIGIYIAIRIVYWLAKKFLVVLIKFVRD